MRIGSQEYWAGTMPFFQHWSFSLYLPTPLQSGVLSVTESFGIPVKVILVGPENGGLFASLGRGKYELNLTPLSGRGD